MHKVLLRAAVIAATAVVVVGCSSSTDPGAQLGTAAPPSPVSPTATPAAQLAAHNVEAPIQDVPWSEVGPGWMLAMWNEATPTNPVRKSRPASRRPTTRRRRCTWSTPKAAATRSPRSKRRARTASCPALADWSGDGSRALFYRQGDDLTVIEVDLRTGERTSFPVKGGYAVTPRYSRPEGKAVLLLKSRDVDSPASLTRVDLTGKQQLTYPVDELGSKFNASYLSTPDGTRLVLGTDTGLSRMGNDGNAGH